MNPKRVEDSKDPLIVGAFAALGRAARRARKDAIRTGTDLVVLINGRIVHLHPSDLQDAEQADENETVSHSPRGSNAGRKSPAIIESEG